MDVNTSIQAISLCSHFLKKQIDIYLKFMTVESFKFVVANFYALWGFFLGIRGNVIRKCVGFQFQQER